MSNQLFVDGWQFRSATSERSTAVRLPHDAMIGEPRSADASTGNHGAYFPGGLYVYTKQWTVPESEADEEHRLFFEGIYGHATVSVDGVVVARNESGYRAFEAPLGAPTPGSTITIEVVVDNTATPNSRWYTGSGIYRQVWLRSTRPVHLDHDGVRLTTRSVQPTAVIDVDIVVNGPATGHRARAVVVDRGAEVAAVELPLFDGRASGILELQRSRLWSADDPYLYDVAVTVLDAAGQVVDEHRLSYGVRTLEVSASTGLLINGEQVLLRGACVHHDNGVLGAATLPAAERRRARILKESGYNAIRASHQPLSRAFLDACDELGLYVMDELTDVWFQHKTPHDSADRFDELWRDDARAMVAEDRNRPSVIMYSIGNEIAETATERGVEVARELSDFMHDLDPTRPTTLAINLLLNMMAARGSSPFDNENYSGEPAPEKKRKKKETTSTAANAMTAKIGRIMELASRLPAADRASRDAFAQVDIAGYNYAFGRYAADRRRYPDRVIVGSESMAGDLPAIWKRVESVPGVIGDFMWTGWDYIGEAGIGTWSYGREPGGINKAYPELLAGPGAIDITGLPGATIMLAQAVWGLRPAPGLAVRPLTRSGSRANKTPWRATDAVASWSWRGCTGTAHIEVYSADDHVELLVNGRSMGRRRAGARAGFITRFEAEYEPGEIVAIGYRDGRETGRTKLTSAQPASLRLRSESSEIGGPDDLAFVWVELADDDGVVEMTAEDRVTLSIAGPAELVGFGSAAPRTEEAYTSDSHSTHFGRAFAVVRPTGGPGSITIVATSERHGIAELSLVAVDNVVSLGV